MKTERTQIHILIDIFGRVASTDLNEHVLGGKAAKFKRRKALQPLRACTISSYQYREEQINYVVRIVQNSATVCLIYKNNKKLQQANATATVYAYVANESTLN